ncbi:coagulation factor 5/8 type domain-containing protein [Planoprotostelium fungivorum]|uniref:Coagulation factor 5/8 type domain-containing protein n=1 Tax=Planoprotostelium fungivorum TaxID=1890364 RepID=A0A2P6NVK3_9EUKA|nr:coagulation factor 5/8 type domain-containing protein [Planoprotostelium fungivorum]
MRWLPDEHSECNTNRSRRGIIATIPRRDQGNEVTLRSLCDLTATLMLHQVLCLKGDKEAVVTHLAAHVTANIMKGLLFATLFTLSLAIRFEAEKGHVIGPKIVAHPSASGSAFTLFRSQEDRIIFTIHSAIDGPHEATIHYHSTNIAALGLMVNGHEHEFVKLPATRQPSDHQTTLHLRAGVNTFVIHKKIGQTIHLDYVDVPRAIPLAERGATLNYLSYEAEEADYNGKQIGPDRTYMSLPSEASGRKAVQISGDQYVEFTLKEAANALAIRFSIPDTADGSGQVAFLAVSTNGLNLNLTVTSKFSWAYGGYPFNKNPSSGSPHHFYDETRSLFGKTIPAGSKVRVMGSSDGVVYTIDMADFYVVPEPYAAPDNILSVVDQGADPTGQQDSTKAIQDTIDAASASGKVVWIPQGNFLVSARVVVDKVTVRGAGPWYTNVFTNTLHGVGFFGKDAQNGGSSNVGLYDFSITGATNIRIDEQLDSGVGAALSNTIIQNLWIEHTKCGMWLDGPFDGFHVTGVTYRNLYADGLNFHIGVTNSVVEQSNLRNTGDDGLAMWSDKTPDTKNVFKFNTIQIPILANGIAIYGGTDNSATDNYIAVQVSNRFQAVPLAGQTTVSRSTFVRCGAPDRSNQQHNGALYVWPQQGPFKGGITFEDLEIYNSSFAGITFSDGHMEGVQFNNISIVESPWAMELHSIAGSADLKNVVATDIQVIGVASCVGDAFQLNDLGGNSGWNSTKCLGF